MLCDIVSTKMAENPQGVDATRNPHVFEIKIISTIFYTGEDPTCGGKEATIVNSAESGIGLEQAMCWESAIHQALMPVTPQTSKEAGGTGMCYEWF